MHGVLSRRSFINLVGRAGGAVAVYRTMAAMGLLPAPRAYTGPPPLPPGRGARVVVVGAGIAGMVAAYELRKAGYRCSVLEARARPGGRNWSIRGGDTIAELGSTQHVAWDTAPHLYFNAGPARIPYDHEGILSYCRELEVPLEVMINDDGNALVHDAEAAGGEPQRARAVADSARGLVAELAAKAVDKGALVTPLGEDDISRLRDFVEEYGALDKDLGSTGRYAGFDVRLLFRPAFWRGPLRFGARAQPPTMLQAVGGMGHIGQAFGKALGPAITYDAEVTRIQKTADGARVAWKDARTGAVRTIDADFVLCTLPAPVLAGLDVDFAPETKTALAAVGAYVPAVRIAFQAERRFWELDDGIYGGISWTTNDITQIWYPTHGIQQKKGILVGAYIWSTSIGTTFARMAPEARIAAALKSGADLHPGYADHVGLGASVAWSKIPFSLGAWAEWSERGRRDAYPVLLRPDGAIHLAGDYLSELTGWQEGAVLSAHRAIADIGARVAAKGA